MDFVCLVENNSLLLVCFNLPLHLQTDLRAALKTTIGKAATLSFCLVHQTILDCLVDLLDDAIWSTRNFVRLAEQVGPGQSYYTDVVLISMNTAPPGLRKAEHRFLLAARGCSPDHPRIRIVESCPGDVKGTARRALSSTAPR